MVLHHASPHSALDAYIVSEVLWIGALPKGARLEWKTKKNSRKPKKKQTKIFQKSCGSGPSPKSLGILCFFIFFLVFSMIFFFFWFSQGFFGFLQGALPKESWNIVFFLFFFFCFLDDFFVFLVFSRFFWFSPRGPPQRVLEYCVFFVFFFWFSR